MLYDGPTKKIKLLSLKRYTAKYPPIGIKAVIMGGEPRRDHLFCLNRMENWLKGGKCTRVFTK